MIPVLVILVKAPELKKALPVCTQLRSPDDVIPEFGVFEMSLLGVKSSTAGPGESSCRRGNLLRLVPSVLV